MKSIVELIQKAENEGRPLDTDETKLFDQLEAECKEITAEVQALEEDRDGVERLKTTYRAMREDSAGGPMIGSTARTLGVRPSAPPGGDIPVTSGEVQPHTGGMSVAPDDSMNLPPPRRPKSLGGSGKDPVWYMDTMILAEFEKALADTRTHWKKL